MTLVSKFHLFEKFNYDLGLIHLKRRFSKFLRVKKDIFKKSFVDIYNCPECVRFQCDGQGDCQQERGGRDSSQCEYLYWGEPKVQCTGENLNK